MPANIRCVIKVENGQAVGNPLLWDNLYHIFPDFDGINIPEGYANFIRHEPPPSAHLDFYKIIRETYVKNGDSWEDLWIIDDMTDEEKQIKNEEESHYNAMRIEREIVITTEQMNSSNCDYDKLVYQTYINLLANTNIHPDPTQQEWPRHIGILVDDGRLIHAELGHPDKYLHLQSNNTFRAPVSNLWMILANSANT
jgi:hypothetical protein